MNWWRWWWLDEADDRFDEADNAFEEANDAFEEADDKFDDADDDLMILMVTWWRLDEGFIMKLMTTMLANKILFIKKIGKIKQSMYVMYIREQRCWRHWTLLVQPYYILFVIR